MSPKKKTVGVTEFGRMIGVSHVAVLHAIHRGRLKNSVTVDPKTNRKRIDVEAGKKEWGFNTDHDHNRNGGAGGRPRRAREGPPDLFGDPTESKPRAPDIATFEGKSVAEWTVHGRAIAVRNEELDLAEREGRLLDVDIERAEWFLRARRARDALLAIPDRIAGTLAAESRQDVCFALLKREIEQACEELARDER